MSDSPKIDILALVSAFGAAAAAVAVTYLIPDLAQFRPWLPGDPVPVVASLIPKQIPQVEEDARTGLVTKAELDTDEPAESDGAAPEAPDATPVEVQAKRVVPRVVVAPKTRSAYPLGFVTQIEDAQHKGMAAYFRVLRRTSEGAVARAIHFGDSTIAADGLARTLRTRLQARFGDAGPGFISAGMDPRWNKRADITSTRSGSFTNKSILKGGASGRYGLGGIVGIGSARSHAVLRAIDVKKNVRLMKHGEVWYQAGRGYGELWVTLDEGEPQVFDASADQTEDRRYVFDSEEGFSKLAFGANNGSIPWYGVVLETGEPGATWESLGVIGIASKSFLHFDPTHFSQQIQQRKPDLVVLMLGGNEADYPVLLEGDGSGYQSFYRGAVTAIRAGAPEASCLMVSPLDQGTRNGGKPRSKPGMKPMLANQRKLAAASGCAYFSAYDAMGGDGSMVDWASRTPPLAWPDLAHVSATGLESIGNILADAILADFDHWSAEGGT